MRDRLLEHVDTCIASLVRIYDALTEEAQALKKAIAALSKKPKYRGNAEIAMSAPGIGLLSAMILLLELGDVSRFDSCEDFASFLGLVPGEWSTGDTRHRRRTSRWGNKRARTVFVESSWTLISKDPRMREVYEQIKVRRGSGRAIVAIARRFALTLRAMLRENESYRCAA